MVCLIWGERGQSQYDLVPVFPDLEGQALEDAVIETFKTDVVLPYGMARDTLFSRIDAVDHVLEGVYTGYKITLDPDADPTTSAYEQGINTEHTYPKSKGAFENTLAYSDMHHLFPTRVDVNADRGSLPMLEIDDNLTDKWYAGDNQMMGIPQQNIDDYSEWDENTAFEPREKHKGDVARAYFYFFTMYRNQAMQAAPVFFENQRETLCQWMYQDPVDETEWIRNEKIAKYQGNKKNPFILDCRLARMYCDEIGEECLILATQNVTTHRPSIFPNPGGSHINVSGLKSTRAYLIMNIIGEKILEGYVHPDTPIDISTLKKGMYFLVLKDERGGLSSMGKFIKN